MNSFVNAYLLKSLPLKICLLILAVVIEQGHELVERYTNRRIEYANPGHGENYTNRLRSQHLLLTEKEGVAKLARWTGWLRPNRSNK